MLAVLLALCGAASNGLTTVLQRRAAKKAPDKERFRLALMFDLFRRGTWLAGVGVGIAGFGFQAAALNFGQLSLVQPLLAMELPMTLVMMRLVFKSAPGRRAWLGVVAMTVGLALFLFALSPRKGSAQASAVTWIIVLVVIAMLIAGLIFAGRLPGAAGAALLGAAAGVGFGITAVIMKAALVQLHSSLGAMLTSWQVYAMIAAGILSVFLLQNALQSGSLVAAQPAVTLSDPLVGVALGIILFGDRVRLGWWIIPEVIGIALIVAGSIELSRSSALASRAGA